ncbi:MAG: ATP-dependent DNA ligase [Oryzihumus sp.]
MTIDPRLYTLKPMLASPSTDIVTDIPTYLQSVQDGRWTAEIKWDGVRCLALIEAGAVKLVNRVGRDITFRYPEVVKGIGQQFDLHTDLVLDGELLVFDNGRPSFPLTAKRDAQSKPAKIVQYAEAYPAVFMAFDCLWRGRRQAPHTNDLRTLPYVSRAAHLEEVITLRGVVQKSLASQNIQAMWDLIKTQNLEGLILKRDSSTYVHKRSKDWVKVKPMHTLSAVVIGVQEGQGARTSTFGAFHLGLYEADGSIRNVGKVGTGFTQADLQDLCFRLDGGHTLVVEIAFQEVGSGGQLRFPSFKGLRTDVRPQDCLVSQMPERVQ